MCPRLTQQNSENKYNCECPECGATDDHTVEVWESLRLYELGMPPKFLGCYSCGIMSRVTRD